MRTLVVAEQYPWPAVDGYRQRLHHLIAGLTEASEVDLLALHRAGTADPAPSPLPGVRTTLVVPAAAESGLRAWGPSWVRGDVPRRLLGPDWSDARDRLTSHLADRPPYDLVWYSHVDTWWPMHDLLADTPSIVDFDNLENLAMRLRRTTPPRFTPGADLGERLRTVGRWTASRGFDLVDERRWDALQRRSAEAVGAVVVCSELDRERSGCGNAVVVPNGCDAPAHPHVDRTALRGDSPTLLFVGALDYEPNTEAVEWFVRDVLPLIREREPAVRVRIVGRGSERVEWVRDRPGVDLVGAVPEIADELDRADVSIVPIRVGAGTRLKVVEALANRIPLVTTTVGCEGIAVTHSSDALVADDPRAFADACLRLISDPALRQSLADAGAALFAARYGWANIQREVAELARDVVAAGR